MVCEVAFGLNTNEIIIFPLRRFPLGIGQPAVPKLMVFVTVVPTVTGEFKSGIRVIVAQAGKKVAAAALSADFPETGLAKVASNCSSTMLDTSSFDMSILALMAASSAVKLLSLLSFLEQLNIAKIKATAMIILSIFIILGFLVCNKTPKVPKGLIKILLFL